MQSIVSSLAGVVGPPQSNTFPWAGSKWRLMPKLVPLMPPHRLYVSVFGGSGADILRKPPSKNEVFNDLSSHIANVFRVLQDDGLRKALCLRLHLTPYGRREFVRCLEVLRANVEDPVTIAHAFLVCAITGFPGTDPSIGRPGNFAYKAGLSTSRRWTYIGGALTQVAVRLRQVLIESMAWKELLDRYDGEDTFFYLDPPYVHASRQCKRMYQHEMSDSEHAELVASLRQIKGKAMLSGYRNPIYAECLADWRVIEFEAYCSISRKKKSSRRTEVVWLNYGKDGKRCI